MNLPPIRRRRTWIIVIPLAVASVAGGTYLTWLWTPPPLPETVEDAIAVVASKRYQRLPEYRQREYLSHLKNLMEAMDPTARSAALDKTRDDPVVRKAMGSMRRHEMMERVTAYAHATPEARIVLLDTMIDRMEKRRAGWQHRREGQRPGPSNRSDRTETERTSRRARAQNRIKTHIEQGNPQHMALIGEFFRALRARREQRGIGGR